MKLEFQFKQIAPGGPVGCIFTDANGDENMNGVVEKVNQAFADLEKQLATLTIERDQLRDQFEAETAKRRKIEGQRDGYQATAVRLRDANTKLELQLMELKAAQAKADRQDRR